MTKTTSRKHSRALQAPDVLAPGLAARIRSRFVELGDVSLQIAEREPVRSVAFDVTDASAPTAPLKPAPPPMRSR